MEMDDKAGRKKIMHAITTHADEIRRSFSCGKVKSLSSGYLLLVFVALVFCLGGVSTQAQTTAGTIVGNLTEQSGAVLTRTQITLTNIGTADTRLAVTNQSGFYQFVNVPPGSYRMSVEKQGFKQLVREPIELQVATTIQINLMMQVGSESQKVLVNARTPLIQAETTSLGAVIDQRETNEIPLNGRNPLNLAALVPSVVPQGGAMQTPTGTNVFAWGNYQIGGGMANQSATYLDGSPLNATYNNILALVPTQDSLQEFKVATNNISPEYGRLAGGAIDFTTKSGTNDLHGSLWEFLRNKIFNANTFFSDRAKLPNPPFTQNQYGFNVGGPVFIPHFYDGRNKTFFFVDWEGFGLRQGQTFTETVPTVAERGGDLSALGVPIYDPMSTCGVPGGPPCAPGTPLYNRTEIPNANLAGRLNPTAVAYLNAFYPLPNTAGNNGQDNFIANTSVGGNNYQTVVHIDQNVSEKQHISGRYTYWINKNLPIDPLGTGICYDRCGETFTTNNFVFNDTYSFNSTTILDMHLSYLRNVYDRSPLRSSFKPTDIGWPASYNFQFPGPPDFWIPSFDPAGIFASAGVDNVIKNTGDSDRIAGNVTKFIGNHTLQFGGEFMRQTLNAVANSWNTGIFVFTSGYTSQNPFTAVGGSDLASYLLGDPVVALQATANPVAARLFYPGLFATDTWRATKRLTFNLGLRWEDDLPFTERHDRLSYFDPTAKNSILSAAGLNYPGSVELVASSTRSSRYNINNNLKQFSPRLGLAYEITPRTIFSMGYGIFWLPMDVGNQTQPTGDEINLGGTPFVGSLNGGLSPNGANLSNPWPNGFVQPPGRANYNATLLGSGLSASFLNNPYPYAQQWNAGIQQQIGDSFVLHIAYGGAKGTHLPFYSLQRDQLPDAELSKGLALLNQVPNPFYGVINPSYGLGLPTVTAGQLLLPYPQYAGVAQASADFGASTYNSLQVTAQKRLPAGASLNLAYTWSKLISNTDTLTAWLEPEVAGGSGGVQDANNLNGERSLSSDDTTQRLVLSYVYDVPVGRGRKFLPNASRVLDYTIGGWGLDGVTTFMQGFPLGFTASQNLNFGGLQRPNYTPGCAKSVSGSAYSRLNKWFNTSCFSQPAAFTFGNEPRNDSELRAAGQANWDVALFKNFPIDSAGKRNVQFRFETFNLFNRVQFGYPGDTQGLPNYGVVSSQANLPRILQFALRINY
jgi:hypothetical protein